MDKELLNFSKEEIENFYKKISNNVKKYRLEKKFSQLDLALAIDIKSVAFYSNCENNRNSKHFNLEHLYKISKILEIPICSFLR